MKLSSYIDLIKVLPYKEQSFKTSKETWVKYCNNEDFKKYYTSMFVQSTVEISRGDLFGMVEKGDFRDTIFSIILWGYPRNMRGNSFEMVLKSIGKLKELINGRTCFEENDFIEIRKQLNKTGIGLSTLSKVLYFFEIQFSGIRSLILDSRIIDVIQYEKFDELKELRDITEFSKDKYYIRYIKTMGELSNKYKCEIDQLELFLFLFGNNLKTIV